jgi:peroxiredoxin
MPTTKTAKKATSKTKTTTATRSSPPPPRALVPGAKAPAFALADQSGRMRKLADHKGRKVLVYFYPKADTPGCTVQSCSVRDARRDFAKQGVDVIGISPDKPAAQQKFDDQVLARVSRCSPTRTMPSRRPSASGARSRCTDGSTWASCAPRF